MRQEEEKKSLEKQMSQVIHEVKEIVKPAVSDFNLDNIFDQFTTTNIPIIKQNLNEEKGVEKQKEESIKEHDGWGDDELVGLDLEDQDEQKCEEKSIEIQHDSSKLKESTSIE